MSLDRVQTVLRFLNRDMTPVEIGADRAPFASAFARSFARPCYASEVADGPYQALVQSIGEQGLSGLVKCYRADGLNSFPPDADTALICGMGGFTISRILGRAGSLASLKTLILEPQSHSELVRQAVIDQGFVPVAECYVGEATRFYPVIKAERRPLEVPYSPAELAFGRIPIRNRDLLLRAYLEKLVKGFDKKFLDQKSGDNIELRRLALDLLSRW